MASDQWLFNEASVASGNTFTKVGSSNYTIVNNNAGTLTRTTTNPTPYEGAGCYVNGTIGGVNYFIRSYGYDTSEPLYLDAYFYIKSSTWSGNAAPFLEGDFDYFQVFTWCSVNAGSIEYGSYDPVNGTIYYNTTAYSVPLNAWIRCRVKTGYSGIEQFGIFTGSGINGSTPSLALPTINFSGLSAYVPTATYINESGNANSVWIDDLKLDTAAYPTRGTAHTAAGSATATATGTAAMSNARTLQASATGTATGTAAASNQRALAASATGTASGTAAMSLTQAMSASATATATGTAAGSITAVVTIDGAGTGTASATAGALSTQLFAASATVTATGTADASIRPLATVDGVGTITATGTTTFNKSQTLAATATATATASASMLSVISVAATATATANATAAALITTPGSLYGNATKVAGLYGSSTKPTLTTRS